MINITTVAVIGRYQHIFSFTESKHNSSKLTPEIFFYITKIFLGLTCINIVGVIIKYTCSGR